MSKSWQVTYDDIKNFIAQHPSIEINPGVMSIPTDVRPDFYRLFDALRDNFVKDNIPDFLEKTLALSSNHEGIRNKLSTGLGLEEIEIETSLNDFIRSPLGLMTGLLSEPAFDLLMGKSNPGTFDEISARKIVSAFETFFQQGYKSWLTLSLLQLMSPDSAFIVPLSNDVSAPYDYDIGNAGTQDKQMLPDAVPASRLSFNRTPYFVLLVPKVIVHSKRLNVFVSLLQEFRFVPTEARYRNQQIEWYRLPDLIAKLGQGRIWPDLVIYLARQPNDLLLVADMFNMARPDIIVNILHKRDLGDPGKLAMFKSQNDIFAPRLGSFIVSSEALSDAEMEACNSQIQPRAQRIENAEGKLPVGATQLPESPLTPTAPGGPLPRDIKVLGVGYDAGKLEPIADAIIQSQIYADLTSNQNVVT